MIELIVACVMCGGVVLGAAYLIGYNNGVNRGYEAAQKILDEINALRRTNEDERPNQ